MNAVILSITLVCAAYIMCEFNKRWGWIKLVGMILTVISFTAHLIQIS